MFDREIGDDQAPSDSGPRAAVYRGKMGRTHRRSARIQNDRSGTDVSLRGRMAARLASGVRPVVAVPALVLACVIAVCSFLYPSAQQYYTAVRDEAKAQAQLDALQEQNEELQQRISWLSTAEGVEDEARSDYGWVQDGEVAVHVSGLSGDSESETEDPSAASASNIEAPDTWYSGVLDSVFGYDKG